MSEILDRSDEEINTQKDKYLTFELADENYGLKIRYVTEIIGVQDITRMPDMPHFILGVINLRGRVIPVMDMRIRFNLDRREYDERTCIIVVAIQDAPVGLVVDKVSEVADIPKDQIEPPPQITQENGRGYVQGVGKLNDQVNILLDLNKLLVKDEMVQLNETISQ